MALAHQEGAEVKSRFLWPKLIREHTITLVDGTADYALPNDFERFVPDTAWEQGHRWAMQGPIYAREWSARKSSNIASFPRTRFKVEGWTDTQFSVDDTPTASETGHIVSVWYLSKTWIKPITWAAGLSFGSGAYCWYNGNRYQANSAGTAGATPPTHTSGNASDGSIGWTYVSTPQTRFLADTDEPLLDDNLLGLAIEYKYLKTGGFEWQAAEMAYRAHMDRVASDLGGAPVINVAGYTTDFYLNNGQIPEGDWSM